MSNVVVVSVQSEGNAFIPQNCPKLLQKVENCIAAFGWEHLGLLNDDLLRTPDYFKFLELLYESRLLFAIRGYEASSQHDSRMKAGIQIVNGHPHLLKDGEWTQWDAIVATLHFDPARGEIVEKGNPDKCWNYLYPNGLTQQTRYHWVQAIHKVSQEEMTTLHSQGLKFSSDETKCRYVQVVSSGKTPLNQIGSHVGIRLIDQDGSMYSIGFEIPSYEQNLRTQSIFNIFATYNVAITSLDFTEFRKFDVKRVTTIPVDEEVFHRVLEKVKRYATGTLRLNFLNQNCVDFATDILSEAGVQISPKTNSILSVCCSVLIPPKMQEIAQKCFEMCPECIEETIKVIVDIVTFIPFLLLTTIKNVVFLILGAGREAENLKPQAPSNDRLTSHTPPFSHWSDIFTDVSMGDPIEMIKWQKAQPSTQELSFEGPKFYIVQN